MLPSSFDPYTIFTNSAYLIGLKRMADAASWLDAFHGGKQSDQ